MRMISVTPPRTPLLFVWRESVRPAIKPSAHQVLEFGDNHGHPQEICTGRILLVRVRNDRLGGREEVLQGHLRLHVCGQSHAGRRWKILDHESERQRCWSALPCVIEKSQAKLASIHLSKERREDCR